MAIKKQVQQEKSNAEVATHHPEYDKAFPFWKRCRDVIEGEDKVKECGAEYLPMLSGQDKDEYEAYKMRSMFYNATGRTLDAVHGAIFHKAPVIEPAAEAPSVEKICRKVVKEIITVGRVGLLTDAPQFKGGSAYLSVYPAESIINWAYEVEEDIKYLTMVTLEETGTELGPDGFTHRDYCRYRVLDIDPGTGHYRVRVFERKESGGKNSKVIYVLIEEIYPQMLGNFMDFIPFVIMGPDNLDPDVDKPPLLDLVNVNLSHYRTSADLEHGRHFTALPTAWVAGFDVKTQLRIGSGVAWVSDNVQANAGYLEFSGAGLKSLTEGLDQKESYMARLGARLFEPSKAGVEAAETTRLRQSADTAGAANYARIASEGVTLMFQTKLDMDSRSAQEAKAEINTDILDMKMPPGELSALVSAWQQGAITLETLLWNLKQGEILPPEVSVDDEKQALAVQNAGDGSQNEDLDKLLPGNKKKDEKKGDEE